MAGTVIVEKYFNNNGLKLLKNSYITSIYTCIFAINVIK